MKALVVAGGKGSRLFKAKHHLNKHCLPVFDRPMIEHVVQTLIKGGVTEIMVLLNSRYPETIMEILEDGQRLGTKIYYMYVREVDGPGRMLLAAEQWVGNENFVVICGDSLYLHPLDFRNKAAPHIWTMSLNGLDDASKYGQVQVKGGRVMELREKPAIQFSDTIQTGAWLFPPDAFQKLRRLATLHQDELHIGMLSEEYVREGRTTHTPLPPCSYLDLGTPEALLRGATLLSLRAEGKIEVG